MKLYETEKHQLLCNLDGTSVANHLQLWIMLLIFFAPFFAPFFRPFFVVSNVCFPHSGQSFKLKRNMLNSFNSLWIDFRYFIPEQPYWKAVKKKRWLTRSILFMFFSMINSFINIVTVIMGGSNENHELRYYRHIFYVSIAKKEIRKFWDADLIIWRCVDLVTVHTSEQIDDIKLFVFGLWQFIVSGDTKCGKFSVWLIVWL